MPCKTFDLWLGIDVLIFHTDEASDSQSQLQQTSEELTSLRSQLAEAQQEAREKADIVAELQGQYRPVNFTKVSSPGYRQPICFSHLPLEYITLKQYFCLLCTQFSVN